MPRRKLEQIAELKERVYKVRLAMPHQYRKMFLERHPECKERISHFNAVLYGRHADEEITDKLEAFLEELIKENPA